MFRAKQRLGGLRRDGKWPSCCRDGQGIESRGRYIGLINATHEWAGSGTKIAAIAPQTVMLMFTMYPSDHFLKEAQKAGIRDIVSKSEGEQPLLKSLKSMLSLVA